MVLQPFFQVQSWWAIIRNECMLMWEQVGQWQLHVTAVWLPFQLNGSTTSMSRSPHIADHSAYFCRPASGIRMQYNENRVSGGWFLWRRRKAKGAIYIVSNMTRPYWHHTGYMSQTLCAQSTAATLWDTGTLLYRSVIEICALMACLGCTRQCIVWEVRTQLGICWSIKSSALTSTLLIHAITMCWMFTDIL